MTPRKPKPKPRKASKAPTLAQRMATLEALVAKLDEAGKYNVRRNDQNARIASENFLVISGRLDALEARASLRDKSHDEPVSNAAEAVGQYEGLRYRIVGEVRPPWWRRFWRFMWS